MNRLFHCLYAITRRFRVVDVTQLLHLAPSAPSTQCCPNGYTIRTVSRDELSELLRSDSISPCVGSEYTLDDPRRNLIAAFYDDQVVSYLWIANQTVNSCENYSRSEHLGTSLNLSDGTVFVFNAWTSPEHRGKRLIASVLYWAISHRISGSRGCLTMIDWTNQRSIRAFEFLGMQRLGWIVRFGRGRFQFSVVPRSAQQLGVQVAQTAPGIKLAW